jgi:hypothetical protein
MPIIRLILIGLIVYLIARSFRRDKIDSAQNDNNQKLKFGKKKVSKSIGEYVDYEEVDKKV